MGYIVGKATKGTCSECETVGTVYTVQHMDTEEKEVGRQVICAACIEVLSGVKARMACVSEVLPRPKRCPTCGTACTEMWYMTSNKVMSLEGIPETGLLCPKCNMSGVKGIERSVRKSVAQREREAIAQRETDAVRNTR